MSFAKSMWRPLLLSFLVSTLAACTATHLILSTKLKKPEIKYVDYRAGQPTREHVTIMLHFNAHNPNTIGLTNVFVNYTLYAHGKKFLQGQDVALKLAPNGDTAIEVPATIVYADLARVIGPTARTILEGAKTLPVTADVTIYGKPTVYSEVEAGALFSFSYSTSKIIDVPIPQDKIRKEEERAKEKLRRLL